MVPVAFHYRSRDRIVASYPFPDTHSHYCLFSKLPETLDFLSIEAEWHQLCSTDGY